MNTAVKQKMLLLHLTQLPEKKAGKPFQSGYYHHVGRN